MFSSNSKLENRLLRISLATNEIRAFLSALLAGLEHVQITAPLHSVGSARLWLTVLLSRQVQTQGHRGTCVLETQLYVSMASVCCFVWLPQRYLGTSNRYEKLSEMVSKGKTGSPVSALGYDLKGETDFALLFSNPHIFSSYPDPVMPITLVNQLTASAYGTPTACRSVCGVMCP